MFQERQLFERELTGHKNSRYLADLRDIKKRKVLRVITQNNSTSYFLYRGAETGFHYELAKWFAQTLGVRLEIVVSATRRDMIPWLLAGKGDMIIGELPSGAPRSDRIRFTRPYLHTTLVVVARTDRVPAIHQMDDLQGATLTIQPSSNGMRYARGLSDRVSFPLHIKAAPETMETEDVIRAVAQGDIDVAIVEKRIAAVELKHLPGAYMALEFDDATSTTGFAVRPAQRQLWKAADDFLRKHYRGETFNVIYNKYHRNTRRSKNVRNESLRADRQGALTPWDDDFKAASQGTGIDWRLLAAQAVQESRLDPRAISPYGAQGLMQLMPATAQEMNVRHPLNPRSSIQGGAAYLAKVMKRFKSDEILLKDRVRFALASYNVGPGHVSDARKLARRLGLNPNRWFQNVEKAMLYLSRPKFHRKAKYGYCRGEEPVRYVSEIQSRYDNYVALTE